MTIMQILRNMIGTKASQARIAMSVDRLGQPVQTPSNYLAYSKEGYQKNAVVNRCIRMISTSCAGICWELFSKNGEIEEHPLINLMRRPNPTQGWSSFFEAAISYMAISGNSYIEAVGPSPTKPPMELWTMRPDLMKVIPNAQGMVGSYLFKSGGNERVWDVDWVTGKSPVLHMKTFNPIDIWYGLSPMESAILGVDQYNQSNRWNLSLLQNMASPSGVLTVESNDANPTGSITQDAYLRLKAEFEESHQSARNAGKPLLLEGGVKWQNISLTPKEMDWIKGREVTGVDICNVYGVPAQMLGLGDTTYSNYKEARQAFYEETILPLMDFAQNELNNWLVPMFGDGLELKYDKDDIEALVEKRESKFTSIGQANWLTQNEKRLATGYEPEEGWDVYVIGSQILAKPPTEQPDAEEPNLPDTEEPTDIEDTEEPEDEVLDQEMESEDEKGWKSFNLLNQNEKRSTWKRTNAAKKRLEKPFVRALTDDFNDLAKELGKAAMGKDPKVAEFAMQKAVDAAIPGLYKTLSRHIKYTVKEFGAQVFQNAKSQLKLLETKKNERTWEDWADKYIETQTAKSITHIEGTTRKEVRRYVQDLVAISISEGGDELDVQGNLTEAFSSLSDGRARTIARTEIASASNSATIEAARSLEIPGMMKEWVSLQDDRTRDGDGPNPGNGPNHLDMNGVQVNLDEKFTVPPDTDMDGPGDPQAGPEQICNCRCTLVFRASK